MLNNKKFISLVLTRQCNSRCSYCKIDFENKSIKKNLIDTFLNFLKEDKNIEYNVEFFGGEPLLNFEYILYFLNNIKNYNNIKGLFVVTNGLLLNYYNVKIFNDFGVKLYISLHPVLFKKIFLKDLNIIKNIKNFEINLIIEPGNVIFAKKYLDLLLNYGIINCKINILPVHYTVFWGKKDFYLLIKFLKSLEEYKKNYSFSYFNDFFERVENISLYDKEKLEKEYLIDVSGNVYIDYESEFYLMKDFLPSDIIDYNNFLLGNIFDENFSFKKDKKIKFSNYIKSILEYQKLETNMLILSRIMKKYQI